MLELVETHDYLPTIKLPFDGGMFVQQLLIMEHHAAFLRDVGRMCAEEAYITMLHLGLATEEAN